jgi:hypothetical protein
MQTRQRRRIIVRLTHGKSRAASCHSHDSADLDKTIVVCECSPFHACHSCRGLLIIHCHRLLENTRRDLFIPLAVVIFHSPNYGTVIGLLILLVFLGVRFISYFFYRRQ